MKIKQDWHIHSAHSCDDACLEMEHLAFESEQMGILDYGISDHLHTRYNMPDIIASKKSYDSIISKNPALKHRFRFGVEASCVSEWEIDKIRRGDYQGNITYGIRGGGPPDAKPAMDLDRADMEKLGIDYIVGGVHWGLYCGTDKDALIRDYHRQYMYMAQHKDVDILAHYLWYNPIPGVDNPFSDFGGIPLSMKQELACALKQYGCAFELNLCAILLAPSLTDKFRHEYLEYAAGLQAMGIALAIGSDCHNRHYTEIDFELSAKMLEAAGIDLDKNMFEARVFS